MEPVQGSLIMLSSVIGKGLQDELDILSEHISDNDYLRILAHYDGDGTSAAIILAKALLREGKRFHIGYIKNLGGEGFRERIEENQDIYTIVVDAGSDQAKFVPEVEKLGILDHHFFQEGPAKALNINARNHGIDGTRGACGATMAYIAALNLNEKNADLFPFFLSGAIADKQDIGGFSGLNQKLVQEYGSRYKKVRTINLEGKDMIESLAYSTDPFFDGISGNVENSKKLLLKAGIDPNTNVFDLNEDEKQVLEKVLGIKLISQGVGTDTLKYLETDMYRFPGIDFTSKEISSIIDGNSKLNKNGTPVQFFLGDESTRGESISNWKKYKSVLIDYAYKAYKELYEDTHVRYFYAPESEMAGSIGGLLMLYLAPQDKPLIGFNVSDSITKVSGRGSRRLVNIGLNLSLVMRVASESVGGNGGGHDIAAGAVIPKGKESQFVHIANSIIREQVSPGTAEERQKPVKKAQK
ncbi:MAG: DHH family phosphoesterase [Candidatus Thermoplasmatota archaeon]|nr:DHH family phosphoesterase [Candidatus Thermoplasmatota archaeon]MCL5438317.1 DHH family phosphoesterase [Candidatus Thermoplasmatota archaeon]